jgi:hypothetical protein
MAKTLVQKTKTIWFYLSVLLWFISAIFIGAFILRIGNYFLPYEKPFDNIAKLIYVHLVIFFIAFVSGFLGTLAFRKNKLIAFIGQIFKRVKVQV